MKLSIIVPAYNASDHIETCLLSLSRQDIALNEYEIIVVNDGSTDNTKEVLNAVSKEIQNVRVISQQNKGNGGARNTGIDAAIGSYIYFLDADDYISDNSLGELIEIMKSQNLDILGFSTKQVFDSTHISSAQHKTVPKQDIEVLNGVDFIAEHNYEAEVWWYILKRDFFLKTGVRFYDRKFVQDSYITPTLFSKAKRMAYIDWDVHRYRQSKDSITRNKSDSHLKKHFKDLSFSINQLHLLRAKLKENPGANPTALLRLHVKQQRYVFIVIVRFIKSELDNQVLKQMLENFKGLEAYPMDKFMKLSDYRNPTYSLLTFTFNRTYLLFPLIFLYRLLKKDKS